MLKACFLVGPELDSLCTHHQGATQVRYSLKEADEPVEMRGERLHIQAVTNLLNCRLPALHHPLQRHLHCTPRGHFE